ncbi:hypothetical protein HKD24_09175 [Gluconobacter sp. LMG 31484]|uniref:Uncharacterized protein n=1 Tax=Gluconobacter vitians TaxID=2728102 RepID=A0ABR9Y623_9PROT|nr:hypothetical protein [Gluconobacter vitians]MBF0859384.1 hypothetical protein [Gluconobacter vitians]
MSPLPKILEGLRDHTPVSVIAERNAVPEETVILIWDQLFTAGIAAACAFDQDIESVPPVCASAGRPSLDDRISEERKSNILRLFKMGLGTAAISRTTGLSTATVSYHRRRLEDAGDLPFSKSRRS